MTRPRLIAAVIAAVVLISLYVWWRSPAVQAPRLWQRLADAIAHGEVGRTMAQLHPDYDIAGQWPSAMIDAPEIPLNADGKRIAARQLAAAGLQMLYQQASDNPLRLDWTIDELRPEDDGVVVLVTLRLATTNGSPPQITMPALTRHRFVLARDGWSAALFIRGHDRFKVDF